MTMEEGDCKPLAGPNGGLKKLPGHVLTLSSASGLDVAHLWAVDRDETVYTLVRLEALWMRNKGLIVSVFLAVMGITLAFVLLSPRMYQSEVKLFLKPDRGAAAAAPQQTPVGELEIASEIELLKGRELLEKAAEQCGLVAADDRRGPRALAVRGLERHLKVGTVGRTSLISVKYADSDANRSAQLVNTLAGLYLDKHTAVHRNRETSEFFNRQTAQGAAELAAARQRLSAFQRLNDASLLEQQKEASLKRLNDLKASLQETESQVRDTEERAKQLLQQRNSIPASVTSQTRKARNEPLMQILKSRLLELENKRTELLSKYDPGYRLLREVEQQIQDTRKTIEREQPAAVVDQTEALNPLHQSIEGEYLRAQALAAGLWARRSTLAQDLREEQTRQRSLEKITAEYEDRQRAVRVAEDNYLLNEKKRQELRIADALDQHKILDVSIVEKAVPPDLPMDQHRALVLLLGALVGVCAGFGAPLVAQYFDRPISSATELTAYTGLPVLVMQSTSELPCS